MDFLEFIAAIENPLCLPGCFWLGKEPFDITRTGGSNLALFKQEFEQVRRT
ncbi:MAG: hypothetical protein ACYC5H_09315 [Methylovirgula sp.]